MMIHGSVRALSIGLNIYAEANKTTVWTGQRTAGGFPPVVNGYLLLL